jgi:hypothetical protein
MSWPISARMMRALNSLTPGIVVTGDRGQECNRGAKGLDIGVDLLIDLPDRRIKGVDLLEMQPQQKAVVPGDVAAQRCLQLVRRSFDPPVGKAAKAPGSVSPWAFSPRA